MDPVFQKYLKHTFTILERYVFLLILFTKTVTSVKEKEAILHPEGH